MARVIMLIGIDRRLRYLLEVVQARGGKFSFDLLRLCYLHGRYSPETNNALSMRRRKDAQIKTQKLWYNAI
jgi:hypothetical protein